MGGEVEVTILTDFGIGDPVVGGVEPKGGGAVLVWDFCPRNFLYNL
jgi:hypothetical protein